MKVLSACMAKQVKSIYQGRDSNSEAQFPPSNTEFLSIGYDWESSILRAPPLWWFRSILVFVEGSSLCNFLLSDELIFSFQIESLAMLMFMACAWWDEVGWNHVLWTLYTRTIYDQLSFLVVKHDFFWEMRIIPCFKISSTIASGIWLPEFWNLLISCSLFKSCSLNIDWWSLLVSSFFLPSFFLFNWVHKWKHRKCS